MKRFLSIVLAVLTSSAFASIATAGAPFGIKFNQAGFFGLWEGIDLMDGSGMQRSITQGPDGTPRIVGRETFFSDCPSGAGIIIGTGTFDGQRLLADQSLKCANDSQADISATYELNRKDGTLIETPYNTDVAPLVYHRISR